MTRVVEDSHYEHLASMAFETSSPEHSAYLRALKNSGFTPLVVYDIGACVLQWTTFAKSLWPDARFVVFDAFDRAEFLYRRAGLEYHMGVISDTDGHKVQFYKNDEQPSGSSYYREIGCGAVSDALFPAGSGTGLTTSTIDTVSRLRRFPPPDLVKIDVQGSEADVLRGAVSTFSKTRHMIVEMQHTAYNEGAPGRDETSALIVGQLGWTPVKMIQGGKFDADYAFTRKI